MADTKTSAKRMVGGWELCLRRAPWADRWEISLCERCLNAQTALMEGELRWARLSDHPILSQTFATPEDAAATFRRLVGAL
jgi:hypothetical protein